MHTTSACVRALSLHSLAAQLAAHHPLPNAPLTTSAHARCTLQAERRAEVTAALRQHGVGADENDVKRFESYMNSGKGDAADLMSALGLQRRGERQAQVRALAMTVAVTPLRAFGDRVCYVASRSKLLVLPADSILHCVVSWIAQTCLAASQQLGHHLPISVLLWCMMSPMCRAFPSWPRASAWPTPLCPPPLTPADAAAADGAGAVTH